MVFIEHAVILRVCNSNQDRLRIATYRVLVNRKSVCIVCLSVRGEMDKPTFIANIVTGCFQFYSWSDVDIFISVRRRSICTHSGLFILMPIHHLLYFKSILGEYWEKEEIRIPRHWSSDKRAFSREGRPERNEPALSPIATLLR